MVRSNPNDKDRRANEKRSPLTHACQACDATGKVEGKTCFVCDGKGHRSV